VPKIDVFSSTDEIITIACAFYLAWLQFGATIHSEYAAKPGHADRGYMMALSKPAHGFFNDPMFKSLMKILVVLAISLSAPTLASAAVMIINGSLHLVTLLPIILVSGRIAPPVIRYLKTGDSRQQLCEFIAKAKVIAAAPEQALKITQAPHTVTLNRVNYQSAQQLTLRDINLSLERGFHTALYGKANAGLEKLLRITAGLEAPTNGNVLIGDQNMLEFDHLDIAQHLHFYRCADFRQRVNIEALINAGQRDQTEWAREQLRQHFAISNTTTKALSPQESQLLAICLAFTHQPTFLLLHMPFRALSPKNRMLLGNFLRSQSSSTTLIYTADKQADAWLGERQIEVNLGAIRNIVGVNALDG